MRNRLVFFGEGEGDAAALPLLGKMIFKEMPGAFESLYLDESPFRIGGFTKLLKKDVKDPSRTNLHRHLEAALRRKGTKAVLLVLDGDHKLDDLRKGGTRSFNHFDKALKYLVDSVKNGESSGYPASV